MWRPRAQPMPGEELRELLIGRDARPPARPLARAPRPADGQRDRPDGQAAGRGGRHRRPPPASAPAHVRPHLAGQRRRRDRPHAPRRLAQPADALSGTARSPRRSGQSAPTAASAPETASRLGWPGLLDRAVAGLRDQRPWARSRLKAGFERGPEGRVHRRCPMSRCIPKLTVIGTGAPPPLPLRPLADEVRRVLDQRRRSGEPTTGSGDRRPVPERPAGAAGRPTRPWQLAERATEDR